MPPAAYPAETLRGTGIMEVNACVLSFGGISGALLP
jgi:hypothetical protein